MRISDWSSDVCSSDLPAIAIDNADLGLEIGMFAEAAAFEHIAKLLLAPAPARLGRVAQRVDELRRLARHTLGPLAHRRDLAVEQRTEERRVGKGGVRTCRSRGSPDH